MTNKIVCAALFALSTAAQAQGFDYVGAGAQGCGTWAKARATLAAGKDLAALATEMTIASWSQGFLSGMNGAAHAFERPTPKIPDIDTIKLYLDKYCRENPLEMVLTGNVQLLTDLTNRR